MADIKRLNRRYLSLRLFMIFVGALFIFSGVLLALNVPRLTAGGNSITAMVVGEDVGSTAVSEEAASNNVSSLIYFVGFVLFGGVLFVVSRYSTELKSVLKVEKDKQVLATTPKAALEDFFEILINWVVKNSTNTQAVYVLLRKMKQENSEAMPILNSIDFTLNGNREDIDVTIGTMPEWEQLYDVFRFFLKELNIDRLKFMHIAEYLSKHDVVIILNKLDEVRTKDASSKK